MSDPFIPLELVPPGVNDRRSRDFVNALSAVLADFQPSTLMIQDAWTVPASLLPIMVVEAGLSEFVSANMREDLLRSLIAHAPEIHARTGTVRGVKLALEAIGISARWTQWWQEEPKAHHNTHKIVLFLSDTVINGHAPLDLANQRAAARVINATKRWSQDIAIQYGLRGLSNIYAGAASRRGRTVRINAPQLGSDSFIIPSYAGTGARAVREIRINALSTSGV
ncbi:phage tail protein I [Brucella sp. 2280]|uniref:phage tail protein I n=1 Tax=Brucella sp. 2280 TaxID=2592625 RepID=UPI001295EAFE|nr:phage tail protein I [Brucella sp. 2280]QGA56150.1 phage tail protein I [Brucella sp. 2280]QGA56480.1 phage tail protein I [Brucella sp. 2280]